MALSARIAWMPYFYPRSPCGERLFHDGMLKYRDAISIHALLAESDLIWRYLTPKALKFLSTLSLRRATCWNSLSRLRRQYFYPRSPCGERLVLVFMTCLPPDFYPRSPCGERPILDYFSAVMRQFLSTLSLRRATNAHPDIHRPCAISIHALLAESDRRGAVPVILII